jgi:hypothetical protein
VPAQIDIPYINSLYLHPVVLQKIYFSFYLLTEERVYFLKGEEESIFLKGDNSSMIHDIILRYHCSVFVRESIVFKRR